MVQSALITVLCSAFIATSCNNSSFKSKVPVPTVDAAASSAVDEGASGSNAVTGIDEGASGSNADTGLDSGNSSTETAGNNEDLGSLTDNHLVSLKVDIVFALDTSASMNDEIQAAQANLQKLIAALNNGRLDPRIHLMLDEPVMLPAGVDSNKIAVVAQAVGSNNAISRLTSLFAGAYAASYRSIQNTPMATPLAFRKEAKLEVVVISDDNGQDVGNLAADFDPMKTLKATFNGIVGLPTSVESDICSLAAVGTEYITLATQTVGSALDICSVDWSILITRLSNDIVKRSVTFLLSKKPLDPKALVVILDGKKLAQADWSFNATTNSVTLIKTDTVKDGSTLKISYNPAG